MKKAGIVLLVLLVLGITLYAITGLFIIQPIGAVPDGVTIWYVRAGMNVSFIESADGLALKKDGQVSLMSRLGYMSGMIGAMENKIIARLPYSETSFLASTGGVTFQSK